MEKKTKLESNLEQTYLSLQKGNKVILNQFDGTVSIFEQAIAGIQASGGSMHDIESIKSCKEISLQSFSEFVKLDSLLYEIQHLNMLQKEVNLTEELYQFRNILCNNILTKHPQNKPVIIDFSNKKLNEISDTTAFYNEIEQLTLDVSAEDKDVIIEICHLLSVPKFVNNSEKSWQDANFGNDLVIVNKLNAEALRTKLLKATYLALSRFSKWYRSPSFNFNTVEVVVSANNGVLKNKSKLSLNFSIVAYDSIEAVNIRYWIDDSTKSDKPFLFVGNETCEIDISKQSLGMHAIYGDMLQMHGETEKWYPWSYVYFIAE